MVADASKIPFVGAEWVPLLNLLALNVDGIENPTYIHDICSWDNARRITSALRIELQDLESESEVDDPVRLVVPPMISILSAVWLRSRQALFLETDIQDERGLNRFLTLVGVRDQSTAEELLQKLQVSITLTVDDSKSMLEVIAEMHIQGKTAKQITLETGYNAQTIQCNLTAFRRHLHQELDEAKKRNRSDPFENS